METAPITTDDNPWMAPKISPDMEAEMIASDPGIWKINGFLNSTTVEMMRETFMRDQKKRFGECFGNAHNHLKCKQCFHWHAENAIVT